MDVLRNVRILIADDQKDVAQTLCRPLGRAGAYLRYAVDGRAALEELASHPYDLILIDMKMPPEEWGGLWLLQQIKFAEWRIPSLILSGEGSKQQVIDAMRLGATDWIIKDQAGEELIERCMKLTAERLAEALQLSPVQLPTPLAYRFARYVRASTLDKLVMEGLHALESILRFSACLGLSSTAPLPLRGVTAQRVATPSMGTWFDICTALTDSPSEGTDFAQFLSWLICDRNAHRSVQTMIGMRNDIAHGRGEPTPAQAEELAALLSLFAHRASCFWRADLAVPTSMSYDGSTYAMNVLAFQGIGKPIPSTMRTRDPLITGQAYLMRHDGISVPLAPWIVAQVSQGGEIVRCLQFDGLQRAKGGLVPSTPLKYAKFDDGGDLLPVVSQGSTWQALAPWIS